MILPVVSLVFFLCYFKGSGAALTQQEISECLQAHNTLRALHHDTPILVWDTQLAIDAQAWADTIAETRKMIHDPEATAKGVGENIYFMDNQMAGTCPMATLKWYSEIKDWDFSSSKAKSEGVKVGHFTQIAWAATTKLGVGIATVPSIELAEYGNTVTYIVAKYASAGNYVNEYAANVKPRIAGAITPTLEELAEAGAEKENEQEEQKEMEEQEEQEETEEQDEEKEEKEEMDEEEKADSSKNGKKKDKKKKNKKGKKDKKGKKGKKGKN